MYMIIFMPSCPFPEFWSKGEIVRVCPKLIFLMFVIGLRQKEERKINKLHAWPSHVNSPARVVVTWPLRVDRVIPAPGPSFCAAEQLVFQICAAQ